MLEMAKENVKKAKLEDRIELRLGDMLNVKDMSHADVVLLYIGDDLGERLGPVLRRTLRPGARVVSHRFSLGDWKPTTSTTVTGEDGDEYELHLWVVGEKRCAGAGGSERDHGGPRNVTQCRRGGIADQVVERGGRGRSGPQPLEPDLGHAHPAGIRDRPVSGMLRGCTAGSGRTACSQANRRTEEASGSSRPGSLVGGNRGCRAGA